MNLGEKIMDFRKKGNMSQENLAEKVGVTRQTISKWELSETCPDINQATRLAKIFNVSLDELTNNILLTRLDVNEKKSRKMFKVIVMICVFLSFIVLIEIIAISFYFLGTSKVDNSLGEIVLLCKNENFDGGLYILYDNSNDIIQLDGEQYLFDNIINKKDYNSAVDLISDVKIYFENNGGMCK